MYDLPTSLYIDNQPYDITRKGDYRMVIGCFVALNDTELTQQERLYSALMLFYADIDCIEDIVLNFPTDALFTEAVTQMYWFFNCGQSEVGAKTNRKLVDWEQDEQMIMSAINSVANTEVRSVEYMHWWTFMGYYTAVGESVFSTVVSIRDKIVKGKKLEDYEKEFKHENPHYFVWNHKTAEEQDLDKEFESIIAGWNSDGAKE